MTIWLVTAILLVTLIFLITDKAPVDLVAVGIMVILTVTGILETGRGGGRVLPTRRSSRWPPCFS